MRRTDISIQKQAQEDALAKVYLTKQLDASEKNFKQMAELAPCGKWDPDLLVVFELTVGRDVHF